VRDLLAVGHTLGNHTFTHPNLIFTSNLQTRVQIEDCQRAIGDAGGHATLFRPPFGGRRPQTLEVARNLGLKTGMWHVTGWDWSGTSAEKIVHKVSRRVRGGDVILLHDGGHINMGADRSQTVQATDRLITHYQAEGYDFVTVPEMMENAGGRQQPSVVS